MLRCLILPVRFRHAGARSKWKRPSLRRAPADIALEYFDAHYAPVFGKQWPSIRLGLLSDQAYCAVPNTFAKLDETRTELLSLGAYDCLDDVRAALVENCNTRLADTAFPETETAPLNIPPALKAFVFGEGVARFPNSRPDASGVVNWYLMDLASLLPVLALDLEEDEIVLDMCAAPGGKSLLMLLSGLPACLVCNDDSRERMTRLATMLDRFIPQSESALRRNILITRNDATTESWGEVERYDKVLVDAPCTADRHSCSQTHPNDMSIFKATRTKERHALPQLQARMLVNALRAVRRGGTVVYATCSLSPLQNDDVVEQALDVISERYPTIEVEVADSFSFFKVFEQLNILRLYHNDDTASGCKFGTLVLPHIAMNFGPMYIAKFHRL